MSSLESHLRSSEGVLMSSDEIDSFIEECRSFIQKFKGLVRCPEGMSAVTHKEMVSDCFVDFLTEREVKNIRKKVFSYWETTKTQQKYGEVVGTFNPNRLQDCEPTTQSEEAVISFEDAKSEVPSTSKRLAPRYDIEQLIEDELKDIKNSKFSEDHSCSSTATTHEAKFPAVESMDFTGIEKKAADLPGMAGIELSKQILPVLNRTDVLEVLLRIYEYSSIDFAETTITRIAMDEIGDLPTQQKREVEEFQKHLVDEIKNIYGRLFRIYTSGTHRAPENVETSNSPSSSTKDSSSSRLTSPAIMSPLELSTSAYPELTTASKARDEDNTISSLPFSPVDSNSSSASGLINDPVIDMAAAQPKSSSSSSGESVSNTNTSSTSVSEDNNTLSGISSLPTDPRTSVSSTRDIDTRTSVSSLKDIYPRTSVSSLRDVDKKKSASSLKDIESFDVMSSNVLPQQALSLRDVNPSTSVSSLLDVDNRTTVSSLRDIESLDAVMSPDVLPQQLLSGDDISDDAFLTAPLVATADAVPSTMDSTETTQNLRRRERSPKEDEDKNQAKRTAH